MRFPCVFVVMFGMTTHSENMMRVQRELWYLIHDEDTRNILEVIIQKMNETRDDSERIKQWYNEAQTFIPADTKYDEKYWVAAYILYFHNSELVNLINQIDDIEARMFILINDLNKLKKIEQETWNKIQELYDKIKTFQEQIETLEEQLESIEEASYVISNDLYDLKNKHKRFLEQLHELTKQIII
jgi:DNA repair exonuclease SbcCD ATPase subunit